MRSSCGKYVMDVAIYLRLGTIVLPHGMYLWAFFVASTINNFATGVLHPSLNVLCLDIWAEDSGPFLNSLHFGFAIGACLAPLIAIPFLGTNLSTKTIETTLISTDVFDNATDSKFINSHQNDTQITVLYPLVGICIVIMSMGYLLLAVKNHKQVGSVTVDSKVKAENNSLDSTPIKLNHNQRVLVIVMIIFFFFYCGSEGTFGIYLVVFSVKSSLKLPKLVGAQIAATFWGCFAAMRFVSIFAAIFLKPIYVMSMSCLVSIIGSLLLVLYGSQSVTILWAGCAMFGFGIASMYATGLLWLKSHMKLTNRIGATVAVASSIGAAVFPTVTGQLMEGHPMTFLYLTMTTITLCSIMFVSAIYIGKRIRLACEKKPSV